MRSPAPSRDDPHPSGVAHYPDTRCFLLTPTRRYRLSLRRYAREGRCGPLGVHEAITVIGVTEHTLPPPSGETGEVPAGDPRWPRCCAHCGRDFTDDDHRQVNREMLYARSDGGPETTLRNAPPGAMWDATWMPEAYRVDGQFLTVRLPNGHDWVIDDEATSCTRRGDLTHRCWVRHGTAPRITVDKRGETCAAGAGSIQSGDFHGYLTNGVLSSC